MSQTSPPTSPPLPAGPGPRTRHDVIVAGGGPAGATTALTLSREGADVLLVERSPFPRFHVGESLLPRNLRVLRELGLLERLERVPHLRKIGAEFAFGHEKDSLCFDFSEGLLKDLETEIFNVERAAFDHVLLEAARAAGVTVLEGAAVAAIGHLAEDDVEVELAGPASPGPVRVAARALVDATGHSTLVGKHLGLRRGFDEHRKVACFGHFRGVRRLPAPRQGHPCIAMMGDAWFWLIAIDEERTSIGVVMDRDAARRVQRVFRVPPHDLLAWAIPRTPFVARRTAGADFPSQTHVVADFSYRCRPYAGPGWFLVGDAAAFLDPIFSTGVCLGMVGGQRAGHHLLAILAGGDPVRERRAWRRFVDRSTAPLFRLVQRYYQHPFRELMMHGEGPLQVHRGLFSLLAGHVFPSPPSSLRWRQRLMELFTEVQAHVPLVPCRERRFLYPPDHAAPALDRPVPPQTLQTGH